MHNRYQARRRLSIAQRQRLDRAMRMIGQETFLRGTERTTKVKGQIVDVDVLKKAGLKIRYWVKWEGSDRPILAGPGALSLFN